METVEVVQCKLKTYMKFFPEIRTPRGQESIEVPEINPNIIKLSDNFLAVQFFFRWVSIFPNGEIVKGKPFKPSRYYYDDDKLMPLRRLLERSKEFNIPRSIIRFEIENGKTHCVASQKLKAFLPINLSKDSPIQVERRQPYLPGFRS